MGNKGLLITGLNLAGNLALLFPLGFLLPDGFIYLRRAQIFYVAFFMALSIETVQALFKIGIFDVDDVLLNGLGLIGGYFIYEKMPHMLRKPCIFLFAAILSFAYLFYITHSIPMLRQ
jgi:glycopeptide antibiotics resistance protein